MIAGLGIDLVDVAGFREQLGHPGSSFAAMTFTEKELDDSTRRPAVAVDERLAARIAAKEAFVKAWSSSTGRAEASLASLDFREIEVASDSRGRPTIRLYGHVRAAFGSDKTVHVSLTHDGRTAASVVVVEAHEG